MINQSYLSNKIDNFKEKAIEYIPTIIISIFIYIIFYVIALYYKNHIIDKKVRTSSGQEQITQQNLIYYELAYGVYYLILGAGLIFALVNLGFHIATILTILGTLGLAFGLAIQDSIKNLISGVYISIYQIFNVGEVIELKALSYANRTIGTVVDFNLYYTTLSEKNGALTVVPNLLIQTNLLTNLSRSNNL